MMNLNLAKQFVRKMRSLTPQLGKRTKESYFLIQGNIIKPERELKWQLDPFRKAVQIVDTSVNSLFQVTQRNEFSSNFEEPVPRHNKLTS